MTRRDLNLVLLNEATPVIGDVAMETITEMVITESAMIGHNPSTPGGVGLGRGTTIFPRLPSHASRRSVDCGLYRERWSSWTWPDS